VRGLRLDPRVTSLYPGFVAGSAVVTGLTVETSVEGLEERKREVLGAWRSREERLGELSPYSELLRRMGSEEGSFPLRRWAEGAVRGELPALNNVLDSCLLASLEHLVPVGAHDLLKVRGEVEVTLHSGQGLLTLRDGSRVAPREGEIVLRDAEKLLASYARGEGTGTRIGFETSGVLFVAWNAPGIPRERVEGALRAVSAYARRYCGGHVERMEVLE